MAISANCQYPELAAEFAMMTASGLFQRTEYFANGGQPGHRLAWNDASVNEQSSGFFGKTLKTLDLGTMRPRFDGYISFQEEAGQLSRQSIIEENLAASETVSRLNRLIHRYRQS